MCELTSGFAMTCQIVQKMKILFELSSLHLKWFASFRPQAFSTHPHTLLPLCSYGRIWNKGFFLSNFKFLHYPSKCPNETL